MPDEEADDDGVNRRQIARIFASVDARAAAARMSKVKTFFLVQDDLPEPLWFDTHTEAQVEFNKRVEAEPLKRCGVFMFGSQSASFWHFGHGYKPWPCEVRNGRGS